MSPIKRPVPQGAIVSLSQSSHYWRKRAAEHTKKGQNRQAAALLRHALSLHPRDDRLRLEYAQCLQAMGCYESSNREAFDALCYNPQNPNGYAVISRNMAALGRNQTATDAYAHYVYLLGSAPEDALVDDNLEAVEELLDDGPMMRMARYNKLIDFAYQAMTQNDPESARGYLQKAATLYYHDDRLFTLSSSLALEEDDLHRALLDAKRAVKHTPYGMKAWCILAVAYHAAGDTLRAKLALLGAAKQCFYPSDLNMVCITACMIGTEGVALNILKSNIRKHPDSVSASFDTAVLLLRMGRLDEAEGYICHCLELDPRDIPSQCLRHLTKAWRHQPPDPETTMQVLFYPMVPMQELLRLNEDIGKALERDALGYVSALYESSELCDRFLYGFMVPNHEKTPDDVLDLCVALLSAEQAEVILRRVLLFEMGRISPKFLASSLLEKLKAKPPYAMYSLGRIARTDPDCEANLPVPLARLMTRLLNRVARQYASPALNTHTLSLLRRMTPQQLKIVIGDNDTPWIQAFAVHHRLSAPARTDTAKALSEMKNLPHLKHRVREAVLALCDLSIGGSKRWNFLISTDTLPTT